MSKFALLFVMVFVAGFVATFFYSSASAFLLYQIVYFLNPDNRWWSAQLPGISYSFVVSILMLVALALGYKQYSAVSPWRKQPIFKWMILILILYYIVGFYALRPDLHSQFAFNYLKLVIVVMVAYKLINTEKLLDFSLWAYVIGAAYIGYVATVQGRNADGRVEGIGMTDALDANDTAAALAPACILLLYYFWMGNKKIKLLCLFCGALIANGLVLINSRGAFLGVIAGAGIYLLFMVFSRYRAKGQRSIAILTVIVGLSGGLYVTDDSFWQRMGTLQDIEDEKTSGSSRFFFWVAALEMARDRPMGIGVDGFNVLSSAYIAPELMGGTQFKSVHSTWMQGLTEIGWIGLGSFLMLLLSLFRLSRKAKRLALKYGRNTDYFKLLVLEAALLSYLVSGTFINRFRAEILYWVILFLAIGVNVYFLQRRSNGSAYQRSGRKNRIQQQEVE